MLQQFLNFLYEEDGPTAVEYAVMIGLIIVVAIGGVQFFGAQTSGSLVGSSEQIEDYITGAGVTK